MDWTSLFLSPAGRIRRRVFWIGFVVAMGASLLFNLIPVAGPILGLLTLWPMAAIHAKRLHDMGLSAWIMLAPTALSLAALASFALIGGPRVRAPGVITPALATAAEGLGGFMLLAAIAMLAELGFLLWVGLTPGQPGANRFGETPAR